MNDAIQIRGARTHNLKNISCDIPHGLLTVVSGVSGSGKSSLAFDTVYAEGQRRYVESLSAYARQFLERIDKPDVDLIDGLAPAIAIKQKNTTRNPRSTVATATEIYDYMRLLFARCGTVHCIHCDGLVGRDSVDEIAKSILALGEGTRLHAIFPVRTQAIEEKEDTTKQIKRGRKTAAKPAGETSPLSEAMKSRLVELRANGFNRLYQHESIFEFSSPESLLDLDFSLPVFVLIDRIVVSSENRARIVDAVEIAYREASEVIFEEVTREQLPEGSQRPRHRFSTAYECQSCHKPGREPEPRLFSFNNPFGACPRCQGFGNTIDFDLNLVIPDKSISLNDGAIDPWNRPKYRTWFTDLKRQAKALAVPLDIPWQDLTQLQQETLLYGDKRPGGTGFIGIYGFFAEMERKKYKLHVRVMLSKYRGYADVPIVEVNDFEQRPALFASAAAIFAKFRV